MPSVVRKDSANFLREIVAILTLVLGIFVFLCLASYHPTDPAFNSVSDVHTIRNLGGVIGSYTADLLFIIFGISAYVVVLLLLMFGIFQLIGRSFEIRVREGIAYLLLLIFVSALIHIYFETISIHGHIIAGGGMIGGLVGEIFVHYLNRVGAILVLFGAVSLSFMLATRITPVMAIKGTYKGFKSVAGFSVSGSAHSGAWLKNQLIKMKHIAKGLCAVCKRLLEKKEVEETIVEIKPRESAVISHVVKKTSNNADDHQTLGDRVMSKAADTGPKILDRADLKMKKNKSGQLRFQQIGSVGYTPPPLSLLDLPDKPETKIDEEALRKQSMFLESKLADFNVEGKVTAIHPGPVITMYEFEPAVGTKINQITNLEDDLSLALGGRNVRVLAHLPGKAAVGIEVPNRDRELVSLREIMSSPQFEKSHSKLTLALGASTDGRPVVADLSKMPHLLVAGATGSGKSVAIHSMIASLLYKCSPEDMRLILVDPKMLELSVYNGIPHLLLPVVTKPKKSILALRWAVKEMERRYRVLSDSGARNIIGYNEKIRTEELELVSQEEAEKMLNEDPEAVTHTGVLPYLVIIIDELADLMMTVSHEIEETITRLAQMARAAGIHLILATQRPSVDVITGLIKANFPSRIAFRTSSKHDARTILDTIGSESLLDSGDMLFMTPQGSRMARVHGSYLSESEVSRIVEHIKKQGTPDYNEVILVEPKNSEDGLEAFDEEDEEVYDKAVALVSETKQASISMIQRRMRIGYNRAARLVERMEAQGIVGPADGSKPREVLIENFKQGET